MLSSDQHTFVIVRDTDSDLRAGEVVAMELRGCIAVMSGFPNDEVLHGHRLWGNGLQFYEAHEILDSRWIEYLADIERHHDQAPETPFAEARHFLLSFHDSTLEAIATELVVVGTFESLPRALSELVK